MNHKSLYCIVISLLIQTHTVLSYTVSSRDVWLPTVITHISTTVISNDSSSTTATKSFPKQTLFQFSNDLSPRNEFLRRSFSFVTASSIVTLSLPNQANADINSAAEAGLPLLGRFEALKGAKAFIGEWHYTATAGIKEGTLVFLKNGEVELHSTTNASDIMAVGAVPWKYRAVKGSDSLVIVTFTLDQNEDDVLIYQGTVDLANQSQKIMKGKIYFGRAEIGARGGGTRNEIGAFSAQFIFSDNQDS